MLTAAYHYLFSESSRAETNDTLFLSLREIIIKVMSRWFTWQSQLQWRTKNAQSSRARRNARHAFMYFSDLYALSSPSVNPSAPNDIYIRRTAQLTTRHCILNIYSTNILTEYFKHAACTFSVFFFFKMPFTSNCYFFFFGSCNIHILNTRCAKLLKKIPAPKTSKKERRNHNFDRMCEQVVSWSIWTSSQDFFWCTSSNN